MADTELSALKDRVHCRSVLEAAGYRLDKGESSKHALKFRREAGEIIIVIHGGRAWFDPLRPGKGDVIALAQHIWGGSIGQARQALRPLAGVTAPPAPPIERPRTPPNLLAAWRAADRLRPGLPAWDYLTTTRGLPAATLELAIARDVLREGIGGTVWALHRDADGIACGWEMRGPHYRGFVKDGRKALFSISASGPLFSLAVTESALDALSLGTLQDWPQNTVYVSTGGGFGPLTEDALTALARPCGARLIAAFDADAAGELLAGRLARIAEACEFAYMRLRPKAKDWNAQLTAGQR